MHFCRNTPLKHRIAPTIVLLLMVSSIYSQDLMFDFQYGYGQYRMSELKKYNELIIGKYSFDIKEIDSYPPYFYFQYGVGLKTGSQKYLLFYSSQSSGSRHSLIDFSGEFLYDTRIKSSMFGFSYSYLLYADSKINIGVDTELGITNTYLERSELVEVYDYKVREQRRELKSTGLFLEPGIDIGYNIHAFRMGIRAGYALDISNQNLKYIEGTTETNHAPDWSGVRFALFFTTNISLLNAIGF